MQGGYQSQNPNFGAPMGGYPMQVPPPMGVQSGGYDGSSQLQGMGYGVPNQMPIHPPGPNVIYGPPKPVPNEVIYHAKPGGEEGVPINGAQDVAFHSSGALGHQPTVRTPEEIKQITANHYKEVPKKKTMVLISLIVGAVISLVLAILGGVLMKYIGNTFGILTLCFSVISLITFIVGVIAVTYYVKRVNQYLNNSSSEDPEKIDQSKERIFINIFFYFVMLCFVFFTVLGIGVLAFRDDIKLYIKSLAYNVENWKDNFGDKTYNDVMSNLDTAIYCLGAFGIIFAVIIGIILFIAMKLLNTYRKFQTIVQFVCVLFFQLGFACVYLSVYTSRLKLISNTGSDMPEWVPTGLLVIALIALVIGVLGFVASFFESQSFLNIFFGVVGVFTVAILVVGSFGAYFVSNIDSFVDAKCDKLFLYIGEQYLKDHCDCENKYLFVTEELPEENCPKDRIIFAWEYETVSETGETNDKLYGCINQNCCLDTFSSIKSKYDYLVLLVFCLVSAGVLLMVGSWVMLVELRKGTEKGYKDSKTIEILAIAAGITLVILVVFICIIPKEPEKAEITKIKIDLAPKENAVPSQENVIPPSAETVAQKIEEKEPEIVETIKEVVAIPPPPPTTYTYTIDMLNNPQGEFSLIKEWPTGVVTIRTNNQTQYSFETTGEYLSTFMEYLTYTTVCPLKPAKATITVADSNNELLSNKEIDFSKVHSDQPITVKGKVIGSVSTIIFKQTIFTTCPDIPATLDGEDFVLDEKLYVLLADTPIEYTYTITPQDINNYYPYEGKITIGGIGWGITIDLGTITLQKIIPPPIKSSISGTILNAMDNKQLSDVTVNLYLKHIEFTPEQITSSSSNLPTPSKSVTSSSTGTYEFTDIEVGQYTLMYSKSGFYFSKYQLTLEEDPLTVPMMSLSPEVPEGNIRVVLSWVDGPSDLDIHSIFKLNNGRKCHTYFGNKNCVGMSLDVDNTKGGKNGVETITITELGNYIYAFYIHKYVDSSGGVAAGERTANGFTASGNTYVPNLNSITLPDCGAKISIYGHGYNTPIAIIDVGASSHPNERDRYWFAFCLNGNLGMDSLKVVNKVQSSAPTPAQCEALY